MSNFGPNYSKSTAVAEPEHYVRFEIVPSPGSDLSAEQACARAEVIESLEKRIADLAQPNYMSLLSQNGEILYQTKESYGRALSCESLCENLKASELTLRLKFNRPGTFSSSSVFELAPEMLEKLTQEETDESGLKMIELRVRAEAQSSLPRNGAMFVSLIKNEKTNLHNISNVDYKIIEAYDKIFHR